MIFPAAFAIFSLLLALPAVQKDFSWTRYFAATGLVFAGVALPLFVFFASGFMIPDWKGACPHGWLDCFHLGKLTLTPLVLWATAALYAVEVFGAEKKTHHSIALGLLTGAVVSGGCLAVGIYTLLSKTGGPTIFLAVPAYICAWHSFRAAQLLRAGKTPFWMSLVALIIQWPFWYFSCRWAQDAYEKLPNQAPNCFIVTAAGHGHAAVVGPFVEITRRGRRRRVNRQLVAFWQLEAAWRDHSPRSHALFRRGYNRVGPIIARRIVSPWLADAVCLALKPAEWLATLWLRLNKTLPH
jgi:hypothetical protein